MKAIYKQPLTDVVVLLSENNFCVSGGRVGGEGDPGALFDPENDGIYDGGTL